MGGGETEVHICKIGHGLDAQLPENKKKIYRQEKVIMPPNDWSTGERSFWPSK